MILDSAFCICNSICKAESILLDESMKKLLLFFTIFTTVNCAFAQLNTDGNGYYYRVQNSVTKRYIRIIDNKGDVSTSTSEVDLNALETIKDFDEVVSDSWKHGLFSFINFGKLSSMAFSVFLPLFPSSLTPITCILGCFRVPHSSWMQFFCFVFLIYILLVIFMFYFR